jgi:hypothetical protein
MAALCRFQVARGFASEVRSTRQGNGPTQTFFQFNKHIYLKKSYEWKKGK